MQKCMVSFYFYPVMRKNFYKTKLFPAVKCIIGDMQQ